MNTEYERRTPTPEEIEVVKESKWMRKIIVGLLVALLTSAAGWIYTIAFIQSKQSEHDRQLSKHDMRIEQLTKSNDILTEVVIIVKGNAEILKKLVVSQEVFGREQARRAQTIIDSRNHVRDRRLHK